MNEQWQELKETITELRDNDGTGTQQEVCKFLANLMGVLEKGESLINNDAVSRQAVLDLLKNTNNGWIINKVLQLPSVTPQQKMGRWIDSVAVQGEIAGQIVKAFNCSECGAISVFRMIDGKIVNGDLCPNCKAKMEVEE
jgi:predicted Zn-ribbon and HTH transcriptional regulator